LPSTGACSTRPRRWNSAESGNYVVDITLTGHKPVQRVITVDHGGSVAIDEAMETQ